MMTGTYRAGIANVLLALLVGGPAAPVVASPVTEVSPLKATPGAAAPAAPVFDDAPPLLPLSQAFPDQPVVQASGAQPKSVWPAGPTYYSFLPLVARPAAPMATVLMTETFEGAFPGTWTLYSFSGPLTGEHTWAKRNCRYLNGANSGWAFAGGAAGSLLTCSHPQPDNIVSWMVSPTFSLEGATAAELRYHLWQRTEVNYDFFYALVSTDGTNFCGRAYSGNTEGWKEQVLDLTSVYGMGNLVGQSAVQVAFAFINDYTSDPPDYFDGAFIDDLSLIRCDGGACPIAPEDALGSLVVRGDVCITPGAVGP